MSDDDDNKQGIYKVDTVPPPAGDGDAYNAPTRVGPMAAAVVEEMMHAAERKAAELNLRSEEKRASKGSPASRPMPAEARKPESRKPESRPQAAPSSVPVEARRSSQVPLPPPLARISKPPVEEPALALGDSDLIDDSSNDGPPPKLYDDEDDEDNAATLLSKAAKPPIAVPVAQPPAPVAFPAPLSTRSPRFGASDQPPKVATPPLAFTPPPPAVTLPAPLSPSAIAPSALPPRMPPQPIPFAPHHAASGSVIPPIPGGSFGPPEPAPSILERPGALYAALAIGFTIFFIGIALYLWAR
jgi:hypothetical protein